MHCSARLVVESLLSRPYHKGHLLVIPLLFKGKTIQNLGTTMLSYELILSNIFIEMSFIVLCG